MEAFGSVWKQYGLKYLFYKNCNASGWLYAANTGVGTCLFYDFIRDWTRLVTGWTWSTYLFSSFIAVGAGLSIGQAGIMARHLYTQSLDNKSRIKMLNGEAVFLSEHDAYRSVSDNVLFNSSFRFFGWRKTFIHQGPLYILSLLIAENFGIFDRNYINNCVNASHNIK